MFLNWARLCGNGVYGIFFLSSYSLQFLTVLEAFSAKRNKAGRVKVCFVQIQSNVLLNRLEYSTSAILEVRQIFGGVNRSFEKKDLVSALRNKPLKKQDRKTVKNSILYEPTDHTKQDPC